MNIHIEQFITEAVKEGIKSLYGADVNLEQIQLQQTRKDFSGDITLVVFPFLRLSKKDPEQTGRELGEYLQKNSPGIEKFEIVKGFLNIKLSPLFWLQVLSNIEAQEQFGIQPVACKNRYVMVEYSSPNTNKPLHLGHIRNNLLGFSVSRLLELTGHNVIKVNLVNDRGIHICKSMLAWKKWGEGITPASSGEKGDHLVGDYYVRFDREYRKQVNELMEQGLAREKAENEAPILKEAQEMLRLWEAKDEATISLWKMMNGWVYSGFEETYRQLGVDFDHIYYESETYLLGKQLVQEGLKKGVFTHREDGSVWVDLTADGLDQKVLLRADGTSVYITQDIGTAHQRFHEYPIDEIIYVVGNEQNYHFQVLSLIMEKLGFPWAKSLKHLSYGMVELPEGKMKSREGKVVDADDLINEMIETARNMSNELGKLEGYSTDEAAQIFRTIGLGALKYFILKVDPKKNMTFDPKESIDFNGNTGPFIQYTYARINSLKRKAGEAGIVFERNIPADYSMNEKEISLVKLMYRFPLIVTEAADTYNPSLVANYIYELTREYNQFYHDFSVLKADNQDSVILRMNISDCIGRIIHTGMHLLGMEVPERM
jgi:arginyl-tRNA synthetase